MLIMAVQTFKTMAENTQGVQVSVKSRGFEFILDEPKALGGQDTGMNPVEALLGALGACKVIVAKSFASFHNINLKSIKVEVEGELDTDGFSGKNPNAKVGFSKIVSNFYIDADNTEAEIADFVRFINRTCPVADTIENAPEMESFIIK